MTGLVRRIGGDHPYLTAVALFELVFLVLPSLIILVVSLGSNQIVRFPPTELSLKWYASLLEQSQYVDPFVNSVVVATFCTIIAIPIGVMTALGLNRYEIRFDTGSRYPSCCSLPCRSWCRGSSSSSCSDGSDGSVTCGPSASR